MHELRCKSKEMKSDYQKEEDQNRMREKVEERVCVPPSLKIKAMEQ